MKSYHLALDHPFGAATKQDGSFEIHDLPAGDYKFRIWHENAKSKGILDRNYSVTIKAGETTEVKITYDASKFN